ncbi:MAG: glycosyltransferase [Deltaproteobacteria bacterium]|jgi:spore maturation protein CgeB|nr:glycosyltransferase [Deltaproteobacteria bacterium]
MSGSSYLSQNLTAIQKNQPDFYARLTGDGSDGPAVTTAALDTGETILIIDGQSQDSRRKPGRKASLAADKLQENGPNINYWYFGLGSPLTLKHLLIKGLSVTCYEPRSRVTLKALELYDFSVEINKGQLIFKTPFDLTLYQPPAESKLLVHPPSGRLLKSQFLRLGNYLCHFDQKYLPKDRPPKILIVGPLSGGSESIGPALLSAGLSLSLETSLLKWNDSLLGLAREINEGRSQEADSLMNEASCQVQSEVRPYQPDLIIFLAQAPLSSSGLQEIRTQTDALLAFWFVEDFELFRYVEEVAPAYDLFFHIQKGPALESLLRKWGLKRAFYLPPAADPRLFRPRTDVPEKYKAQVSMMGAGYPNRRLILNRLLTDYWLKSNHPATGFKIFGSGWPEAGLPLSRHLFEGGRRVTAEECALIYAGTDINLNIHSGFKDGFNPRSAFVNPRTFELAASGAFQLADQRPLLSELFSEKEVAAVSDPKELPEKIEYYLAAPQARLAMGQAARTRVMAEHQYAHRLQYILDCAKDLSEN